MTEASKGKTVNYTEAQALKMVEAYTSCDTDETRAQCVTDLAVELAKGEKSIRAKLVREGVYIAKSYVSKAGATVERKADIVQGIATAMGVTEAQLGGLEKATKPALELIRASFQIARDERETQEPAN